MSNLFNPLYWVVCVYNSVGKLTSGANYTEHDSELRNRWEAEDTWIEDRENRIIVRGKDFQEACPIQLSQEDIDAYNRDFIDVYSSEVKEFEDIYNTTDKYNHE